MIPSSAGLVTLVLLNAAQPDRPWRSCTEKRRCVVCEDVFRGEEVRVRRSANHEPRLACPGCGAGPALWVRLGNPLVNAKVWEEWNAAMELVAHDDWPELDGWARKAS